MNNTTSQPSTGRIRPRRRPVYPSIQTAAHGKAEISGCTPSAIRPPFNTHMIHSSFHHQFPLPTIRMNEIPHYTSLSGRTLNSPSLISPGKAISPPQSQLESDALQNDYPQIHTWTYQIFRYLAAWLQDSWSRFLTDFRDLRAWDTCMFKVRITQVGHPNSSQPCAGKALIGDRIDEIRI